MDLTTEAVQRAYIPHRVGSGNRQSWKLWPPETPDPVTLLELLADSGLSHGVRAQKAVGASLVILSSLLEEYWPKE